MPHTCIWCDAVFEHRMDLEDHVSSEHPSIHRNIRIRM